MGKILEIVNHMDPKKALTEIAVALKRLFPLLDEESRSNFIMNLIGEPGGDKVSSMVHLWLAECMGEGVDPTQMCQSLVDKVTQSKQLISISNPEVLILFEDWLEELENEVIAFTGQNKNLTAEDLAKKLGLSSRGADFLISKLKREGKM